MAGGIESIRILSFEETMIKTEPILWAKLAQDVIDRIFSLEKDANMGSFAEMFEGQRK